MGNIRRDRGYNFEYSLVQRFNQTPGWQARRLGGSSTGLPDIVAVNTDTLFSIEAKAGEGNMLYVPPDELDRCQKICEMFSAYQKRIIILAFKFLSKHTRKKQSNGIKNKTVEHRRLEEYYFQINEFIPDSVIRCNYDGTLYCRLKDSEDFIQCTATPIIMPWQKS